MSIETEEKLEASALDEAYRPKRDVKVIKKDGSLEAFHVQKVIDAVGKSAYRALTKFTEEEKKHICQYVIDKVDELEEDRIPIPIMHNIVESALEDVKPIVAKSYRDYRNYKQDFVRMMDDVYKKSQSIMYVGDKENANTDSALVSTKRSLIFNELNKELYRKFFMNRNELQACRDGYIYIHDQSARLDTMNCCLFDVGSVLKGGFEMGNVWYNEPKTLDTACRRILEAKYKLGLFDDPYKYCDLKRPKRDIFTKEHRDVARKIASESFVLLKNQPAKIGQAPVLPLAKKGTVAVIGPLANTRSNMPGTWSVAARLNDYPSVYEGLKEMMAGKVNITYAKGSNLSSDAAYEERATMFGRSLNRDNRTDKEMLEEALKVAANADVIVAALGESSEMSGESSSRTDLNIPDVQRTLLEALLKTGKPVVLTLFTGRPLTLTWEQENVPAILNVWFGGSEAAYAIGDVLFGDVNPSGKLTMTFPKNVGQIPLFYNHKNTGRPLKEGKWFEKFRSNYLDVDNDPLYPFGYGLSYTTFQYGDITLSAPAMDQDGSVTAVVTVTNTGKRDGAEVVQLYIRDLVGSITRPVKELKGFEKIFLKAGESKTVSFKITPELLYFYDYDLNYVAEPGDFDVMIGGNSQHVKTARLSLK